MRGGEGGTRAGRTAEAVGQWPSPRTRDAARPGDGSSGDEEGCALERCAAALKYRHKDSTLGKRAWLTRVGRLGEGVEKGGGKQANGGSRLPLSPPTPPPRRAVTDK